MTLERQLEQAYANVAQTYEPTLAGVPFRLSTSLLDQAPAPALDGAEASADEEPVEQIPVPYVLLTAAVQEEDPIGTMIHRVDLTIEAGDNVQSASAEGGRLDAIFQAATRPLSYRLVTADAPAAANPRTLFQLLSDAVQNFQCFGATQRGNSTETAEDGPLVMRRMVASFFCVTVSPAS